MIIVSFIGGLGNQLFQYAIGRKISIVNRESLFFDVKSYETDYLNRKLSIKDFKIKGKVIRNRWIMKVYQKNTALNQLLKQFNLLNENIESSYHYKPEILKPKAFITYLSGFWQTHKYFEDIRELLLNDISIQSDKLDKVKGEMRLSSSSVSVHIRRTDYLLDDRYGFLGKSYYMDSIGLMKSKLKDPEYFIFSDDIKWCKNNLPVENATYISTKYDLSEKEELMLMSFCSHHIIANSSFSWWGAWLCRNEDKIVIRPARPFNDPALEYEYYYPESWIAVA